MRSGLLAFWGSSQSFEALEMIPSRMDIHRIYVGRWPVQFEAALVKGVGRGPGNRRGRYGADGIPIQAA